MKRRINDPLTKMMATQSCLRRIWRVHQGPKGGISGKVLAPRKDHSAGCLMGLEAYLRDHELPEVSGLGELGE